MSLKLDRIIKQFIVNEGQIPSPTILTYIQSLAETIDNMRPRSQSENRRLSMAKQQLKEIKKMARKMQERVAVLEERVSVLEEIKEDIGNAKTNS